MVYLFLAEGFEEAEAVAPADILRRAGAEVRLVGVGGLLVKGAHGIGITADLKQDEAEKEGLEMIVLPGGMPGTANLENDAVVQGLIEYAYEKGLWIGAICAAPSILGHKGFLKGKKAVCYPGYEKDLEGARVLKTATCEDGNIITANGPGAAMEFGILLASKLKGTGRSSQIRNSMMMK
ncbi:MAG TPA: DJ-1 family glyoxalase III [Clostridia bacterium]|nr:DJ-1 family glyoxalase III [Clostridia bacterium]